MFLKSSYIPGSVFVAREWRSNWENERSNRETPESVRNLMFYGRTVGGPLHPLAELAAFSNMGYYGNIFKDVHA